MPQRELTPQQIAALVDTNDPTTGLTYPSAGLQPYHDWLIQSLQRLAASSAGDLRVSHSDASDTSVWVAPGRATVDSAVLAFDGDDIHFSAFDDDTALVWLEDNSGEAAIGAAVAGTGWPVGAHLKLAEVVLVDSVVTSITDRRFETMLKV